MEHVIPLETIDRIELRGDDKRRLVGARFTHPDQSATECLDYLPIHPPKPEPPPHPGFVPWWLGWRILEYEIYMDRYRKAVQEWEEEVRRVNAEAAAFKVHAAGKVRAMLGEQ